MAPEHPEDWDPSVPRSDVRAALAAADAEAGEHGGDYAAGMRNARRIVEEELFD